MQGSIYSVIELIRVAIRQSLSRERHVRAYTYQDLRDVSIRRISSTWGSHINKLKCHGSVLCFRRRNSIAVLIPLRTTYNTEPSSSTKPRNTLFFIGSRDTHWNLKANDWHKAYACGSTGWIRCESESPTNCSICTSRLYHVVILPHDLQVIMLALAMEILHLPALFLLQILLEF